MDQASRRRLQEDLTRLADGDREAFHPVFVALLPRLRAFALRSLPAAEAEDVAQEALVKICFRAAEFDRTRDALSWALGITAYEIKTARRRRQRRREDAASPEGGAGHPDPAAGPEDLAIERDLDAAVEDALRRLPASDAETLRAYAYGDRTPGVAPATFRKRVERGLARLRAQWRAIHGRR